MTTTAPQTQSAPAGLQQPLRAFFGHHKCATGWIDAILWETCAHLGLRFKIVHQPHHFAEAGTLAAHVEQTEADVFAYTNADIREVRGLPPMRGFHVVRDPRDVLISAYYSHLHSHDTEDWPELELHRDVLSHLSKADGIRAELAFSRPVFEDMARWDYDQEDVLELRMEDLTAAPSEGFTAIFRHLDLLDEGDTHGWARDLQYRVNRLGTRGRRHVGMTLPLPRRTIAALSPAMLQRILRGKKFERMARGRSRGEEDVRSHYRKGQPGDWRNHFDDDLRRAFEHAHPGLVAALGYAADDDW